MHGVMWQWAGPAGFLLLVPVACGGESLDRATSAPARDAGADGAIPTVHDAAAPREAAHAGAVTCSQSLPSYCAGAPSDCIGTWPADPTELCALRAFGQTTNIERGDGYEVVALVEMDVSERYYYEASTGVLVAIVQRGPWGETCIAGPPGGPPDSRATVSEPVECGFLIPPTPFESACAAIEAPAPGVVGCEVRGCHRVASRACRTAFACTAWPSPLPFDCSPLGGSEGDGGLVGCCTAVPTFAIGDGGIDAATPGDDAAADSKTTD